MASLTGILAQDGDTFVVADCGGGTADLISYKVIQAEPLIVKECVKGSGRSTPRPYMHACPVY